RQVANLAGNTRPAPEGLAKIKRRLTKEGDQRRMATTRSGKQERVPDSELTTSYGIRRHSKIYGLPTKSIGTLTSRAANLD
ncbi:MAG: hypothetical protein ACKPGT_00150, partial [Microcystis sp.]